MELRGAVPVPGLVTTGSMPPPQRCAGCGAAFPWSLAAPTVEDDPDPLAVLDHFLRRLPLAIRQLRSRHGTRPPFRVDDVHDLEDLLRALLPLYFDSVRLECRTPLYSPGTRTDFILNTEGIAVVAKRATTAARADELAGQWPEDIAYYCRQPRCQTLVGFVYDPEGFIHESSKWELACSGIHGELMVRCIVAGC